jgi:hypothetical protein
MFHGEWKYPNLMQVLHLNSTNKFVQVKPSTINVTNFAIPSFT